MNQDTRKKPNRPSCPKCGSKHVAWILWGLPAWDETLEEQLERGEVVFGGCAISDTDARWECVDCKHKFGRRDD